MTISLNPLSDTLLISILFSYFSEVCLNLFFLKSIHLFTHFNQLCVCFYLIGISVTSVRTWWSSLMLRCSLRPSDTSLHNHQHQVLQGYTYVGCGHLPVVIGLRLLWLCCWEGLAPGLDGWISCDCSGMP